MAFQIFSQRDPRWAGHALGSGAGELGPYGCLETCFTMVAYDAYSDMRWTPDVMDNTLWADRVFSGDLLPDNALDRAFPNDDGLGPRFQTHVESGWNQADVNKALASPDTYAIVCIHNPAAGVAGYHFMVVFSPTQVADPWWGRVMAFSAWGGPAVAVKVLFIKSLKAQREAARAARAAQAAATAKAQADAAAAAAKAKADAAAALAAAQAAAATAEATAAEAARAQAAAEAEAAREAAAADVREAASQAAADAAARAAVIAAGKATPPTSAPGVGFWNWLDVLILAILGKARG